MQVYNIEKLGDFADFNNHFVKTWFLRLWRILQSFITVQSKTADYTAQIDDRVVLADATSAQVTVTIPDATTVRGKWISVKKVDSSGNNVVISPTVGNVDGAATATITTQYTSRTMISDGSNWWII